MKFGWKKTLVGLMAGLAVVGAAFTVYGAVSISNLSISVKGATEEGVIHEPEISVSPSSCEISEISWSKPVEDWKPGKAVFATLTITAAGDREFEKSYKSNKCSVTGADFRSASADKEDPSVLEVSIRYMPTVKLGTTEEAGWSDEKKTRASWKKVPYATMYEVRIYQDDTWVSTIETQGTSVDLSSKIKSEGDYYYEVRAKGKTVEERKYIITGEYVTSEDSLTMDSQELGEIGGNWQNYQEGRKYRLADGSSPVSQWLLIMGKWYYFNEHGFTVVGWFQDAATGIWYFMDDWGSLVTGWKEVQGVWYYFNQDGQMQTGWLQPTPGEWYYLNPDGSMAVNTVIDGIYIIGSDGRMVSGN